MIQMVDEDILIFELESNCDMVDMGLEGINLEEIVATCHNQNLTTIPG